MTTRWESRERTSKMSVLDTVPRTALDVNGLSKPIKRQRQ